MSKDYHSLAKDILVALRTGFSQEQINRRLRFKTNQAARWESGHSRISWEVFCDYCMLVKAPLKESLFKNVFYDGPLKDQKKLVEFLIDYYPHPTIAARMKVSSSFVSRLKSAKAKLYLDVFLQLIDLSPYDSLTEFVAHLTNPHIPTSIVHEQTRLMDEKKFHFEKPWAAALLFYLQAKDYRSLAKHSDHFLSLKLGLPEKEIREALVSMEKLKIIEKRNDRYRVESKHLNTGGSFTGAVNIRKHWMNYCLKALDKAQPGQNNFFGYKVFPIAKSELELFEKFYFRVNAELDSLIRSSQKENEAVYLFSWQMLDLDQSK